jgi:type III pantothenate kinase
MTAPRTLVVDVGNTTVFAGIFLGARLVKHSRLSAKEARQPATWTRWAAGRTNSPLQRAALCSVVPALTPIITRTLQTALAITPSVITATAPHGLTIAYRRPAELGTDRIACALGARTLYPRRHVIVVDCGTATTVTAIDRSGTIRGGAILPGIGLWPEMLAMRTAQLPRVELLRPRRALGRSPAEALQSGCFFGHVGAIRELVGKLRKEAFGGSPVAVIGTGGHAARFARENLFTVHEPDLILTGLHAFAAQISAHA